MLGNKEVLKLTLVRLKRDISKGEPDLCETPLKRRLQRLGLPENLFLLKRSALLEC